MSDTPQVCSVCLDTTAVRGCINLRGCAKISPIVIQQLGQELPGTANTMSFGSSTIYWLGPDEWLILTDGEDTSSLMHKLRDSLSENHTSVTDVSGGYIILRISGSSARDVLSKGCTLNLSPADGFVRGICAQSSLAKSNVLLGCIDEQTCFEIIVRRSYSQYLMLWLTRAGAEYGLQITRSQ